MAGERLDSPLERAGPSREPARAGPLRPRRRGDRRWRDRGPVRRARRIPLGINADEGDRAATSIQFLRGVGEHHPFGAGWYHISNVYFRLLAVALRIAGENYVGARTFGAFFGVLGLLAVLALAARHFGWRRGSSRAP